MILEGVVPVVGWDKPYRLIELYVAPEVFHMALYEPPSFSSAGARMMDRATD
jgi:hypothetical protein